MSPKTITVIGSLNIDLVTLTPRVPDGGETLTATSFSTGPGGKGANQAVACARLSRPNPASTPSFDSDVLVKMIGAVGDDEFGPSLISSLKSSLIDTTSVQTIPNQSTGVAVILVESSSGENRILFSPGANHSLNPPDFTHLTSLGIPHPTLLILQLEIPLPTILQILTTASRNQIPVLLNPAPAQNSPSAYPSITHLILNETEAAILTSRHISSVTSPTFNWRTVTSEFLTLGCKTVIITLGAKGAIFATGDTYEHVPAEKNVQVVDTTAAGDTFVGAYAVELVRNGDADADAMLAAVAKACKAAARTVEKEGAQSAIPWADEVERSIL
ncbi:06b46ab2-1f21-49f5-bbaf-4eaf6ca96b40 [Sclerotinia trifoliorum]|uniref:Ribokinase n=1 Tax=Sclerotinia trifoliorum TaxID=28548 RepID=A0A8H2W2U8_9HELO|nr:06b46ab2-1f21-49f5-bbaf-4eaf6ca96b40 [Sclerotinia trifoliorum]